MQVTVLQAILLGLFAFLFNTSAFPLGWLSMNICSKPLIHAFVIGLIIGDVTDALLVGSIIAAAYIGQMSIGGVSTLPTITTGLWFALPLSLATSGSIETQAATCLTMCLAFSPIETLFKELANLFKISFMHFNDQLVLKGKIKLAVWFPYVSHVTTFVLDAVIVPVFLLIGQDTVLALVEMVPDWMTGMLDTYISLIPACGFMMLCVTLIRTNWQFIFFIFGFVMYTSLGFDTLSITFIGCAVAYIIYLCTAPATPAVAVDDEED